MANLDSNGRVKITQSFIARIKGTGSRAKYHDSTVAGLFLRVGPDASSKVWYLDYRNHDGRRQTYRIGSAQQFSVEAAKREARKQLVHIAAGSDPAADKRSQRLEAIKANARTLSAYLEGEYWQNHLRHAASGGATRSRIRAAWKPFLKKDMESLTPAKLTEHRSNRRATGVSVTTLNRDRTALMALLNQATRDRVLEYNPVSSWGRLKPPRERRVRYLEPEERRRLLEALKSEPRYFQVLVQLAMFSGMRRGELFRLTWQMVNLQRGEISLSAEITKTCSSRVIPLPQTAAKLLRDWKAEQNLIDLNGHVFLNPYTRQPFTDIKRRWHSLLSSAHISNFRFHDCRHDYASRLVQEGIDLYHVKELLGHSSIELTQRYAHLRPDALLDAVQVLS